MTETASGIKKESADLIEQEGEKQAGGEQVGLEQADGKQGGRFINPLNDYGFKRIFSNDGVLRSFLTDLLEPKSPISGITYLDKELPEEFADVRNVIYDIRCKTEDGSSFLVEMQCKGQEFFSDRILYYLSRSISLQRERGEKDTVVKDGEEKQEVWDYRLTPVYGIFFLNFQLKGFKPLTVRTIQLKVKETGEFFTEKLTAYTLELESFRNKTACVCKMKVEYWLYNIANMTKMNELAFTKEQPAFKLISDIAELAKLTPEEREIYMEREKQYLSYNAVMKNERKEGILEGILRTATTMKAKGYNIEEIAECTGLTVEEIRDKIS